MTDVFGDRADGGEMVVAPEFGVPGRFDEPAKPAFLRGLRLDTMILEGKPEFLWSPLQPMRTEVHHRLWIEENGWPQTDWNLQQDRDRCRTNKEHAL